MYLKLQRSFNERRPVPIRAFGPEGRNMGRRGAEVPGEARA